MDTYSEFNLLNSLWSEGQGAVEDLVRGRAPALFPALSSCQLYEIRLFERSLPGAAPGGAGR